MFHGKIINSSDKDDFPTRTDFIDLELNKNIEKDIKKKKPLLFLSNCIKESAPFTKYTMYLSGILPCGSKCIIKICNIKIYFLVKFKNITLKTNNYGMYIRKLKQYIENYNDDCTENNKKVNNYDFSIEEGKKLFGFQKEKEIFIKISTVTFQERKTLINLFDKKYSGTLETFSNATSSYYRVVAREHEINIASWNKITNYSKLDEGFKTDYAFQCSIEDIEQFTDFPETIEFNEKKYDNLILRKDKTLSCTFDIEVYTPFKEIPYGDKPEHDLFMIGLTFQYINEKSSVLNLVLVDKECEPNDDYLTILCKNEKDLILTFALILGIMQPDIITEYNGTRYDWVVIKNKIEQYKIYSEFKKNFSLEKLTDYDLKPDIIKKYNLSDVNIKISADKQIIMFCLRSFGFVSFDSMIMLRKLFPNVENYKLNTLLKENNLQLKDDLKISTMFEYFKNSDKKGLSIAGHYCYQDSFSVHSLLFKTNFIQDKREHSIISFTSLEDSFYRADAMRVLNLTSNACYKNKCFYSNIYSSEKGDKFPGAFVLEPKKGYVNIIMNIKDFIIKNEIDELYNKDIFKFIEPLYNHIYNDFIGNIENISYDEDEDKLILQYNTFNGIDYYELDILEKYDSEMLNIIRLTINDYISYVKENRLKYPVCALDFSSLYPSLIMTYNISPEYWIKNEEEKNELEKENYEFHHISFEYGKTIKKQLESWVIRKIDGKYILGIFPTILNRLFNLRVEIKKILSTYNKKIEYIESFKDKKFEHISEKEYEDLVFNANYYTSKQLSVKLLMNTFYGVLGATTSPLFSLELAGGVTTVGRYNLLLIKKCLEDEKQAKVYYGDTDSLYFSISKEHFKECTFNFFTGKLTREEYAIEMVNISFKVIDQLAKFVNEKLYENNGLRYLKMAYEEILLPALFIMKKQYFGLPHEGIANISTDRKLFIRGLEVKKKGNSKVLIDVYTCMMKELLNVNTCLSLKEIVEKNIKYLFTNTWKYDDFIKSKPYKPDKQNITVQKFVKRMKENNLPLPEPYERFNYLMIKKYPYTYDLKGKQTKLNGSDQMEYLEVAKENKMEIDLMYYFNGELITQFARILCCLPEFNIKDINEEIDDKKTLDNCKKYIVEISNQYNNSYKNKGSIFKELYKKVLLIPTSKYKKFKLVNDIKNDSLDKLIEKEIKKCNTINSIKEIINYNGNDNFNDKEKLLKFKKLFNSKVYSFYTQIIKKINVELLELRNSLYTSESDFTNIDKIIKEIRNKYNFMEKCKDKDIEKLEDIIDENSLKEIVSENLKFDENKYNQILKVYDEIMCLELQKKIYTDIFEHINVTLLNLKPNILKPEPKKLSN